MFSVVWISIVFSLWRGGNSYQVVQEITLGQTSWGEWSKQIVCPDDVRVDGFTLRVEPENVTDKTALNGIGLSCADGSKTSKVTGTWGTWGIWNTCDRPTYVTGFNLRSLGNQGSLDDDSAATNVKMRCNNNTELVGDGLSYGTWDNSSSYRECQDGSYLCGVQAKIEGQFGLNGDNTALNQLKFLCCKKAPIHGGWGAWGPASACSATCLRKRHRNCTNPSPRYGGMDCLSAIDGSRWKSDVKIAECNNTNCPVVVNSTTLGKTTRGNWSATLFCPKFVHIVGFRLRVQKAQGNKDDTALNGIQLYCDDGHPETPKIYGAWGEWMPSKWCGLTFVTGFNFRSQSFNETGDNTAGNNVNMICSDNKELLGDGLSGGSWDRNSYQTCSSGTYFCGVQARIEPPVSGDNTSVNQLKFLCCTSGTPPTPTAAKVDTTTGTAGAAAKHGNVITWLIVALLTIPVVSSMLASE